MITLYKTIIIILFIYAAGHMAYTFYYNGLATPELQMWFFSAGIALLFNALINLVYLKTPLPGIRPFTVFANLFLLAFLLVLAVIVPEMQVFILCLLVLAVTIVAGLHPHNKLQTP